MEEEAAATAYANRVDSFSAQWNWVVQRIKDLDGERVRKLVEGRLREDDRGNLERRLTFRAVIPIQGGRSFDRRVSISMSEQRGTYLVVRWKRGRPDGYLLLTPGAVVPIVDIVDFFTFY